MPKITFIGAGGTVFAKNPLGDILSFPELADATISLHDIDEDRLRTSEIVVAHKVAQALDAHPTIEATTDRRASLDGADYAICTIQMAGYKASKIKTVSLCHSVQGTAAQLARDIGVPIEEVNYLCTRINHMAFYLRFERKTEEGVEDLYPHIRQIVEEGRVPGWNRVRYEMLAWLGYFVTESSEHFAEHASWLIKRDRPDLIERFSIPLDEYPRRCELQIAGWEALREYLENPETTIAVERTHEYGAYIIHSLETGTRRIIYGNVPNRGPIDNLPPGCIVEMPCVVDKNGIQPTRIGALPPHLAALIQTNINVQALTVEAALTKKRECIYHAAMLDPHTGAELDLDQIRSLVDDLIEAHGAWLPVYD